MRGSMRTLLREFYLLLLSAHHKTNVSLHHIQYPPEMYPRGLRSDTHTKIYEVSPRDSRDAHVTNHMRTEN